jgi:hypothetical protein
VVEVAAVAQPTKLDLVEVPAAVAEEMLLHFLAVLEHPVKEMMEATDKKVLNMFLAAAEVLEQQGLVLLVVMLVMVDLE